MVKGTSFPLLYPYLYNYKGTGILKRFCNKYFSNRPSVATTFEVLINPLSFILVIRPNDTLTTEFRLTIRLSFQEVSTRGGVEEQISSGRREVDWDRGDESKEEDEV